MSENFSEESLRKIAEKKVNFRMSVQIHAACYVIVNILLVAINLIFSSNYFWFFFPLLGWFAGLAIHLAAYMMYANGVYPIAKRAVYFHLVAYLTVNPLLIVANYITSWAYLWFLYPLGFWAAGFVIHVIIYFVYFEGGITKEGESKSRRERAVEKEMEKIKEKMEQ
ncbi:MAG: hypothetical protein EAX96_10695 [Candidatus Lokiarchaeota archaeon]|nr:hypothetical protein [Candidatus Lokiarchaeota archaeon]